MSELAYDVLSMIVGLTVFGIFLFYAVSIFRPYGEKKVPPGLEEAKGDQDPMFSDKGNYHYSIKVETSDSPTFTSSDDSMLSTTSIDQVGPKKKSTKKTKKKKKKSKK